MLQVRAWPNVILHLDGDAFFVSVLQAVNPKLKGKPVVAGSERGIATAVSYEAKKIGIKRTMRISEVKKLCPQCIIMDSDYELYSLFSQKMFEILRQFSPIVEEYSIDEAFADIKGLRRPLNMTYREIGQAVKNKIESALGISISVGISVTKSLAKLASNSQKPSGLTIINGLDINRLLAKTPVINVWGIGENTTAYLNKLGINTALEFVQKSGKFVERYFNKSIMEIWSELRGNKVYELDTSPKTSYKSMQSTQTFHPPTNNRDILWSKLWNHIEEVFERARYLNYHIGKINIFLKTQDFRYYSTDVKLQTKISYPLLVRDEVKKAFLQIHQRGVLYRTTGATISELEELKNQQQTLFTDTRLEERVKKIYPLLEKKKVVFASSLYDRGKSTKGRSSSGRKKLPLTIPIINLN